MSSRYSAGTRALSQRGVAIILVIFIVALVSILVTSAAYSTHLNSRRNATIYRAVKAEYLLKSALNVARVLLKADKPDEDSSKDLWGKFLNGIEVPGDLLGVDEPNIRVSLEIRPEDSKIPLSQIAVDAARLVSLMVDYADGDKEVFNDGDFPDGFEGEPGKEAFPNRNIQRLSELASIPGFTSWRLQRATPFLAAEGTTFVTINTAPREVLKALSSQIDDTVADQIIAFRDGSSGPIAGAGGGGERSLDNVVSPALADELNCMVRVYSSRFQVVAKVDFDTSTYFLRAIIRREFGELPMVQTLELF